MNELHSVIILGENVLKC